MPVPEPPELFLELEDGQYRDAHHVMHPPERVAEFCTVGCELRCPLCEPERRLQILSLFGV